MPCIYGRWACRSGRIVIAALAMLVAPYHVWAQEAVSIPDLMFQPSVNLVLSVADVEDSREFYGEVLGLRRIRDLDLPGGLVMTRYQVGTTEIKFLHSDATMKSETGAADAAIGIRRLRLFFRDGLALRERFARHQFPPPKFIVRDDNSDMPTALVRDPDGNEIELAIVPEDAQDDALEKIELGLTVADVEASRKFYRDFIGFAELEPLAATSAAARPVYRFRHGNTTIRIASHSDGLPVHTGRWEEAHGIRYIQYIVRDLDAVRDYAEKSAVRVEQDIFPLGRLARILFLADPDGIINEFVGLPK